ncbi:MAG: translesion error-prone DNA polymerase V autoproteolytic subunit [Myxococcales bacterium]
MAKTTSSTHGGPRLGAGRKPNSGRFHEPTRPIRVPESLIPTIRGWLDLQASGDHQVLTFTPCPRVLPLPLFGCRVPAGFPSPADDHLEDSLDLNDRLVQHPAATFFVRVQGDSMTGAGIHHGDLLVVDRACEPKSGAIVVAVINGDLTVKRLLVHDDQVMLVPENTKYRPIEIGDGNELVIWGVVVHAIHSF